MSRSSGGSTAPGRARRRRGAFRSSTGLQCAALTVDPRAYWHHSPGQEGPKDLVLPVHSRALSTSSSAGGRGGAVPGA